ncbi:MAG TPA: NADH-quinone oxidoreductase subunit L [Methylomirabilota bacterium]|jgi:NADH-quinone oxidoreductase subunit L|nr:NADH-quinone oxidoreductase subunit L [Methylomirabilota bacterium]
MRVGSPTLALVVLGLPFLAFLLLALVRPLRRAGRPAAYVSTTAMGLALVAAFATFRGAQARNALANASATWSWIPADGGPMATVGVLVDDYSMAMLTLVTLVSFLVQLYSVAYLHDEPAPALGRYYAYQSLFAFSMLGLVLAPGFLQMFVFWELVGLCSYLLIGFWYTRPSAARAAVKAFWITKIGDLGFVAGIVMLWAQTGTFDFWALGRLADSGALPFAGFSTIMFLVYLGAVGKSAQFPLHVWLPDAMEGPTPVSALIHAATMVTAGVYLVTRAYFLFALVPDVLTLMAWVGAFTALLAASMACVESDIKRVLAYSTVSQLGYMMAAAGAGAPDAGFAHLLNHGVFKALLFLGAGVVIHVFHTNDMFRMGGLFRAVPWIGLPFLIATLALAGVWPLPGYFSKEAILGGVLEARLAVPFLMLALTAFLTSFYMFRAVFLVFFGARGHDHAHGETHAVPWQMDGVCRTLAALTVALGLWMAVRGHHGEGPAWLPALSLALAAGGFLLAYLGYQRNAVDPARIAAVLRPLDVLARHRYFIDAFYAALYRFALLGFARVIGWIDRYLVDGVLNMLSAWTLRAGDLLRRIQTGQPQDYVYGVALGLLALVVWAQWWGK